MDKTIKNYASDMASAHWDYVESVIRTEYDSETDCPNGWAFDLDAYCRRVGHHFKTAFEHGFKHGFDWKQESS